jgi:aspartyl/asparaginyl beta-hydroxylase (cupin superfamily)
MRADLAVVSQTCGAPSARFARALDLLTGRSQLYLSSPRLFLFPELPTIQFQDRALFAWITELEAATDSIRSELTRLLAETGNFSPYLESDPSRPALNKGGLIDSADWSACYLWKNGQRVAANADRCPVTEAVLARLPLVRIPGRSPSVLFSLMKPGAHILPHHGFVNTRLIGHLPLVVPPGCRFRVGNETHEWVPGKAWLFDDTIEHEAWNNSQQDRVVLIFEIWRPELTAGERAYVSGLFQAIERQRGGVGDWRI